MFEKNSTEYYVCDGAPKIEHFNGNDGLVRLVKRIRELDLVLDKFKTESADAEDKLTRMEEIFRNYNIKTMNDEIQEFSTFQEHILVKESL